MGYIEGMKIAIYHTAFLLFLTIGMYASPEAGAQGPLRCGDPIPPPAFTPRQQAVLDSQLMVAQQAYARDSTQADNIIWYARRLGYLGRYAEATQVLAYGIRIHPADARFYRHRGHRYLTLRCFDKAVADLEQAARLIGNQPDVTEPDGQPNAANIPVSTLHTNIYYHLGLAYYLQHRYDNARSAWEKCLAISRNNDMHVATANWLHLVYRRTGDEAAACRLLANISPGMELLENQVYLQILLLYKQKPRAEEAMAAVQSGSTDVQNATYLYGLYRYLLWHQDAAAARQVKQQLLNSGQWGSFGFIAAEQD